MIHTFKRGDKITILFFSTSHLHTSHRNETKTVQPTLSLFLWRCRLGIECTGRGTWDCIGYFWQELLYRRYLRLALPGSSSFWFIGEIPSRDKMFLLERNQRCRCVMWGIRIPSWLVGVMFWDEAISWRNVTLLSNLAELTTGWRCLFCGGEFFHRSNLCLPPTIVVGDTDRSYASFCDSCLLDKLWGLRISYTTLWLSIPLLQDILAGMATASNGWRRYGSYVSGSLCLDCTVFEASSSLVSP